MESEGKINGKFNQAPMTIVKGQSPLQSPWSRTIAGSPFVVVHVNATSLAGKRLAKWGMSE